MEELFGISMNSIMVVLLAIFIVMMAVVVFMAWRNRVMLKLGLRNIPRRRAQSVLIVVGSMLSAVIIASAFGIGDTISFSIRDDATKDLGTIDEVLRSTSDPDNFGRRSAPYFPRSRFDELKMEFSDFDAIDGMVPYIAQTVPVLNADTSLTEPQARVTAPDPEHLQGFWPFTLVSGGEVLLQDLDDDGVYINDKAADELDARTGHVLHLFLEEQRITVRVEGVVEGSGIGGRDPTILMPLRRAQDLFDAPEQINAIAISNRGGARDGADLSEEVAEKLRVFFADQQVASELKALLNKEEVLDALEKRAESLSGNIQEDISVLRQELPKEEVTDALIRVLSDGAVANEVRDVLEDAEAIETARRADTLFRDLAEIQVFEIKRFLLDIADQAGSGVTSIFIMFGLFSIVVGILLIFLIFVMLAAARRTDMGMSRAVGAKRSHLVQMFVFEGTAYDLAASVIGTSFGLLVSFGIISLLNHMIGRFDEEFGFSFHLEARSVIVAFCLGMIITFATAAVSAYRVSRMNIAEAVRGLPETIVLRGEASFSRRLLLILKALVLPFIYSWRALRNLVRLQLPWSWLALGGTVLLATLLLGWLIDVGITKAVWWIGVATVVALWWIGVWIAIIRFLWPYLRRGWLTILLGVLLVALGVGPANRVAPFAIGSSLIILGIGLMLRLFVLRVPRLSTVFGLAVLASGLILVSHGMVKGEVLTIVIGAIVVSAGIPMTVPIALGRTDRRPDVINRLAFTFIGVIMLAYWMLPFDTMEPMTGVLEDDIEMFFISGIVMVTAAVWTVMYNADLLLRGITSISSRFGKLRPVLVTAVAYPMSTKFRTGLTLAMFALVVFTMMVMSLLNEAFSNTFSDADRVLGEWDLEASVSFDNPISDIRAAINENPDLSLADFEAIGGYIQAPIDVRQPDSENQRWKRYSLLAGDDEFLDASRYDFKITTEEYGSSKEEIWQALRRDPGLAVIDAAATQGSDDDGIGDAGSFKLDGVSIDDEIMSPVQIVVLDPRSEQQMTFTIIGVLDSVAADTGIITSKSGLDEVFPFQIPLTNYRFRLADGVDAEATAKKLESSFLENGMETQVLAELLADIVSFINSFYNLLTGYMGLGIVVGIAGLGVVSMRAVVERRQQIGVLRAIGYRQGMIQLSFLLESSFVALLGVALGVVLGTIISINLVDDIEDELEGLKFGVPWLQIIIIIGATYIFSMLATILPARQASRTTPAEALRYE